MNFLMRDKERVECIKTGFRKYFELKINIEKAFKIRHFKCYNVFYEVGAGTIKLTKHIYFR